MGAEKLEPRELEFRINKPISPESLDWILHYLASFWPHFQLDPTTHAHLPLTGVPNSDRACIKDFIAQMGWRWKKSFNDELLIFNPGTKVERHNHADDDPAFRIPYDP